MDPLKIISVILALVLICILVYLITRQVRDYYTSRDPKLGELLHKIKKAVKNCYEDSNLCTEKESCMLETEIDQGGGPLKSLDHITLHEGDSSYSLNKHKIYLCLKKKNGEYYDDNMLLFVLAHEIAHCLCPNVGHTKEWQEINDELLHCLIKQGVYKPPDKNDLRIPPIMDYCGH